MSAGDVLGYGVLMLLGIGPLWFSWTARRRRVRILLALVAMFFLGSCGMAFVMGASADELQGTHIDLVMLILGGLCGLAAIGALILSFSTGSPGRSAGQRQK